MGRQLQTPVAELLERVQQVTVIAREYRKKEQEIVRLGMPMITCSEILVPLMSSCKSIMPQISLHITQGESVTICEQLRRKELDIVCVPSRFVEEDMGSVPFRKVQNYLLFAKGHRFSALSSIPPSELEGERLLIGPHHSHYTLITLEYLRENHAENHIDWSYSTAMHPRVFRDVVATGVGVTFQSSSLLENSGVDYRPMDPPMEFEMSLAWLKSKGLGKTRRELIRFICETYGNIE